MESEGKNTKETWGLTPFWGRWTSLKKQSLSSACHSVHKKDRIWQDSIKGVVVCLERKGLISRSKND